jgi:putative hydrolase of the HAD superfamily
MKVVFDFGGVLFRWHPAALLARVWPHRLETPEQAAAAAQQFFQGYGGDWGLFDQGLIGADEVVRRISARTGWPRGEVAAVVRAGPDELLAIPATVVLLRELRAVGHGMHFLSNMPEPFAAQLERVNPLSQWFTSGVFSSRVKHSKPGTEVFKIAQKVFDAAPSELVFLDDHPANVEAAKALGWDAILFTDAAAARRELVARGLLAQ